MKIYTLTRKQFLPIDLKTAWDFFSSPKNLGLITPKRMNFQIVRQSGSSVMHEGQTIAYRVTVLPFIRLSWVTEIVQVTDLVSFEDEQRRGPYSRWHHRHLFREVPGGVEMTDEVTYAIPFGLVGRLAHLLFVGHEVNRIFDYRFRVLKSHFDK